MTNPTERMISDLGLSCHESEVVLAFNECFGDHEAAEVGLETVMDAYHGRWESEAAYVESFHEETGELDKLPEAFRFYVDWEAMGRDWFINDLIRSDEGHVFARCW